MVRLRYQRQYAFVSSAIGLLLSTSSLAATGIQITPTAETVYVGSNAVLDILVDPSLVGHTLVFLSSPRLGATPTPAGYLPLGGERRVRARTQAESASFQVSMPLRIGPRLVGQTVVVAALTANGSNVSGVSNPISAAFDLDRVTINSVPLPEGVGWSSQNSGTSSNLQGVSFTDSQTGWIAGTGQSLLHTTDGGETWTQRLVDRNLLVAPTAVQFVDPLYGWTVSNFIVGLVYSTTDGGNHWQLFTTTHAVNAIDFIDRQNGFAVGFNPTFGTGGPISMTTNGGRTWTNQATNVDAELWDVKFLNRNTGIAAGRHGVVLVTHNGGTTWTQASVPAEYADSYFLGVEVVPGSGVWVVGSDGAILFSQDGYSFTARTSGTGVALRSASFVSPSNGWVIGDAGTVLATFDAGQTWVPFEVRGNGSGGQTLFLDLSARSASAAWAVGGNGIIRKFGSLD